MKRLFLFLFAIGCFALAALMIVEVSLNNIPPMGFVVAGFLFILGVSAIEALSLKHQKIFYLLMLIEFSIIIILLLRR